MRLLLERFEADSTRFVWSAMFAHALFTFGIPLYNKYFAYSSLPDKLNVPINASVPILMPFEHPLLLFVYQRKTLDSSTKQNLHYNFFPYPSVTTSLVFLFSNVLVHCALSSLVD